MRRGIYTFIGILLIIASVAGLVISGYGIFGVWRVERSLVYDISQTFDLLDSTLANTADGISIAAQTLDQASVSLDTLVETLETTGKSVSDTIPLVESLSQVATRDVPETIAQTQDALLTAQTSARVIDTTLTIITSIPFLPLEPYNTQKPLGDALKDVSTSLDPISASLTSMDESLQVSLANLDSIELQFNQMSTDLKSIGDSVRAAKSVTDEYLVLVADLQTRLDQARDRLPAALNGIAWFFTVSLCWLGLTQIGLLMQGLEMMGLDFVTTAAARKPEPPHEPSSPKDQA